MHMHVCAMCGTVTGIVWWKVLDFRVRYRSGSWLCLYFIPYKVSNLFEHQIAHLQNESALQSASRWLVDGEC